MREHSRWATETDDVLRSLWGQGLLAEDIASRLGRTKNSVIGRAHRLGLSVRRATSEKIKPGQHCAKVNLRPRLLIRVQRKAREPVPVVPVPQPVYQPVVPPTRYGDMAPGQCRNIIGEEEDVFDRSVCGNTAQPESSFCPDCHARMWVTPPPRPPGNHRRNSPNPRRRSALIAEGV